MLRDRRIRQSTIIDNQTRIRQENSSLYHQTTDRIELVRTDQICSYRRRAYRRQTRVHPYLNPVLIEHKSEPVNENLSIENSVENNSVVYDDREFLLENEANRSIKRTCQQKLKAKCQSNKYSNESLLVSLLKQETTTTEKKPEISIVGKRTIIDEHSDDSTDIQLKSETKDPDFSLKKNKMPKKTSTKTQVSK